ncbi:hypothetical protein BKA93DRAFT_824395 [Sparassis latifolia]
MTLEDFRDVDRLQNATTSTFENMWPDFAQANLMVDPDTSGSSSTTVDGMVHSSDLKLIAHPLSVRLAQGTLSALIFVVIGVYILWPQTVLPRDPSSLAALATLLAAKEGTIDLDKVVSDTEGKSVSSNRSEMQLRFEEGLATVKSSDSTITPLRQQGDGTLPMWRPLTLHPITGTTLAVLIVGTIVALQYTYCYSMSHHGFGDSDTKSSALQTLRNYVAPIYIFILVIMLSSYLSAIQVLDSYISLARSPMRARSTVMYAPASCTQVGLVWHATQHHSIVGLLCAAMLMTLPFLKIAVAGLLITTSALHQSPVTLNWTGTFNNTYNFGSFFIINENGSAFPTGFQSGCPVGLVDCPVPGWSTILSQIPQFGLSLPDWVTATDAVGVVDVDPLGRLSDSVNVTVPLPMVSAQLFNCSALESSDYNYTVGFLEGVIFPNEKPGLIVQLPPSLDPVTCSNANDWVCPSGEVPNQVMLTLPQKPGYFGEANALYGGYIFYYGKTQDNNASQITDLVIVECAYNITQSTKQVTITKSNTSTVPILTIDQSSVRDAKIIIDHGTDGGNLPYFIFPVFPLAMNASQAFDTFNQILTLRNISAPLSTFLDPSYLIPAVQELYTAFWAIYANVYMRLPVNRSDASHPGQIIEGVMVGDVTRVSQASVPTRVIQALLGVILACALLRLIMSSRFSELEVLGEDVDNNELGKMLDSYQFALGWSNDVDRVT